MNELVLLQEWFAAQCDGDWEHGAGVRIESLDNPGWLVTIDLGRSAALEEDTVLVRARRSEHDWVDAEVRGGAFVGAGAGLGDPQQGMEIAAPTTATALQRAFITTQGYRTGRGGCRC